MTALRLTSEQRAQIAALIGDVPSAPPAVAVALAEAVQERRGHDHPRYEDLFCSNLAGWLGERVPYLLRLLLDLSAEAEALRAAAEQPEPSPHQFVATPDIAPGSDCKSCGEHVFHPAHDYR
ncbi:hypothetical protein ACIQXD_29540 [Streptomyces uncialis]|uniref:hypothetical protein n=1 Tax=Streptomyces uncialis TaxID=1048205 RepID=UPI003805B73A